MIFSKFANQVGYPFKLIELPYGKNLMEPYMKVETFDFHYNKHHQAYVNNLNKLLIDKADMQNKSLEEIIIYSAKDENMKGVFNNAAQIWNHNFFWHSLGPREKDKNNQGPSKELLDQINRDFGGYQEFTQKFQESAAGQFASGWAWLVYEAGELKITTTSNADLPIIYHQIPILTCDVWEHAYYLDYRNNRVEYLRVFVEHLINWNFAKENFLNAISNE